MSQNESDSAIFSDFFSTILVCTEVVKKQYELYKAACDSLGGVSAQP